MWKLPDQQQRGKKVENSWTDIILGPSLLRYTINNKLSTQQEENPVCWLWRGHGLRSSAENKLAPDWAERKKEPAWLRVKLSLVARVCNERACTMGAQFFETRSSSINDSLRTAMCGFVNVVPYPSQSGSHYCRESGKSIHMRRRQKRV